MKHNSSQNHPGRKKPAKQHAKKLAWKRKAKPLTKETARRLRRRRAMTKEAADRWAERKADALMRAILRVRVHLGLPQQLVADGCALTRQGVSFMERGVCWALVVNVLRVCASMRITLRQLAMIARC